jgi:hypothetical protein
MKAGDRYPLTRRLRPAELAASCLFSFLWNRPPKKCHEKLLSAIDYLVTLGYYPEP